MSNVKPKAIYVAGPMRGLPEFNFPAFRHATETLRAKGYVVFNPAERDIEAGFDPTGLSGSDEELAEHSFCLRSALGADTKWICEQADAIYLLKGWENSTGAIAERALAEALGLEIIEAPEARTLPMKIREFIRGILQPVA